MITVEGHERRQLHPAVAELFVRVALEPTRVRSDERDLIELELKNTLDAEIHVLPFANVVSEPVTGPFPRARERGAADHKRSLAWVDLEQSQMGGLLFHEAPHVVNIQLYDTVRMSCVRGDRMRGQEAIRCRH